MTVEQAANQPAKKKTPVLLIFIAALFFLLCAACAVGSLFGSGDKPTPTAVAQATEEEQSAKEEPTATAKPTDIPKPVDTPTPSPTNTSVAELAFVDVVQHPDEKSWSSTQFSTYLDSLKGQRISEASGTVLEVDTFAGKPYISLDLEPGEPVIDAYVYIEEKDLLKVGLGQTVTFAGVIDSTWPEDNGFYALQIENAELLELGEIPTPTAEPPTPTLSPTDTPEAPLAGDIPIEVALYAGEISEPVNSLAEGMTKLGTLLQDPKPGDESWAIQAATQVTIIRLAHETLTQITPPTEMEEIHTLLLDATSDCNESMDYLISGIDNLNVEDMNTASRLIIQCGEKMEEPSRLMVEYQAAQGGSDAVPEATATQEVTAAATATPAPAAPTPVPPTDTPAPPPPAQLSKDSAMGVPKQVGVWTMKLYQVKKAKAVYYFGEPDVAEGVYLMPFIEFTNTGPGSKAPIDDLSLYIVDGAGNRYDLGFSDGDLGAAHQFQAGHVWDDIDPGVLLGIVIPGDVPEGITDAWLKVEQDPNFIMYLGDASTLPSE